MADVYGESNGYEPPGDAHPSWLYSAILRNHIVPFCPERAAFWDLDGVWALLSPLQTVHRKTGRF